MRTIIAFVVLLLAVILAVQNAGVVTITILAWRAQASLAIVVGVCLTAGVLVGVLISTPRLRRMRADQKRLRTRLAELGVDPDEEAAEPPAPVGPERAPGSSGQRPGVR